MSKSTLRNGLELALSAALVIGGSNAQAAQSVRFLDVAPQVMQEACEKPKSAAAIYREKMGNDSNGVVEGPGTTSISGPIASVHVSYPVGGCGDVAAATEQAIHNFKKHEGSGQPRGEAHVGDVTATIFSRLDSKSFAKLLGVKAKPGDVFRDRTYQSPPEQHERVITQRSPYGPEMTWRYNENTGEARAIRIDNISSPKLLKLMDGSTKVKGVFRYAGTDACVDTRNAPELEKTALPAPNSDRLQALFRLYTNPVSCKSYLKAR